MSLACSQKQAVITLIEKKGKDHLFLENWQLISLLSVDVKMFKVITTKIKNALHTIIHHNQTIKDYINQNATFDTVKTPFKSKPMVRVQR